MRTFLKLIFLLFSYNSLGEINTITEEDPFILLNQAYDKKDWQSVAKLQKKCFLIDRNPSRLIWSSRCYAWLRDSSNAFNTIDSAIIFGYSNIYILQNDTSFNFIKGTDKWKQIYKKANEKYLEKEEVFYWGFYYGILGLIFVFNIFLFFSNKELSYLFLSLIILADIHYEIYNNSSLKIYITKLLPWIAEAIVNRFPPPPLCIGIILIGYLLFAKDYLKSKINLPKINLLINCLIITIIVIVLDELFELNLISEWLIKFIVSITFLSSLFAGMFSWKKKLPGSKYFVLAVLTITIGTFTNNSVNLYIFSPINIGILLFFTILTIGVGSKIKIIQKEKEEAQEKALELLEQKVLERTEEVVYQKHLIEEKQKEIVDSITYAKRLQEAILPPIEFVNTNLKNNFIYYQPKDIVAGDFYWAEKVGDKFFIAAADSTGHGVPGAMVSVVCSNALNRTIKEFKLTETGKILDKTRDLVLETFEKSEKDVKDGMDISLLCIDSINKKIFWSGANNPLWYIQNNELHEIKADKQPIGKTDNPKPFTTHQINHKENTTFYLFTDGFADQFGGPNGKKFKYKQFSELLIKHDNLSAKEKADIINKTFLDWKGNLEQVDDVCVIGIKL